MLHQWLAERSWGVTKQSRPDESLCRRSDRVRCYSLGMTDSMQSPGVVGYCLDVVSAACNMNICCVFSRSLPSGCCSTSLKTFQSGKIHDLQSSNNDSLMISLAEA
jgi:hypothetical protein